MRSYYLKIVIIAALLGMACTTKVSEWVLINADPDKYALVYYHNGTIPTPVKQQHSELENMTKTANLLFRTVLQENIEKPYYGLYYQNRLISEYADYNALSTVAFSGFEEAFSYNSEKGKVICFKINDRQFLEFIEDKNAKDTDRLVSLVFDCDNPARMEVYLRSKNIPIVRETETDAAGNEVLVIQGTEFYSIKFTRYLPEGLHNKTAGKFLGENRIAHRLHHAGLHVSDVAKANRLYREVLGFSEMWRFREENDATPITSTCAFPIVWKTSNTW